MKKTSRHERTVPIVAIVAALALTGCSGAHHHDSWPSFRGTNASGVADGQDIPDTWNVETGENIRFRTAIPGLAHASPVVWGDTVYLTTAISGDDGASFKHGLYGSGDASEDRSVHHFDLLAIDADTGDIRWQATAHAGQPRDKRHIKATYANSSPATDGEHIVALFGSEGLYCFTSDGELLWKRDLGRLDLGAYDAPTYEWGSASSPIIYDGKVIVQCDSQGDSFVAAFDITTGDELWRTARDEPPSWGTPTVYTGGPRHELVTNASNFIRGYDPQTGAELWRLGKSSNITAPTPIFTTDRIVVASGRRPTKPIYAIRPGATGDITLADGETTNAHIAWSRTGHGPYMPTPIIYQGRLYSLNNNGALGCYDLESGDEFFRERIPHAGGGFSASPVASDRRLFLPGEDGDMFVLGATTTLAVVAVNSMAGRMMATPAISNKTMYVRTEHELIAVTRTN